MANKEKKETTKTVELTNAFELLVDAVHDLTKSCKGFVDALNPSAILVFNQACRDLQATIGQSLVPIVETFTSVIRQSSAIISPAMLALAPIFRQLSQIVGGVLTNVLKLLADVIMQLAPLLQFVNGIFEVLAGVIKNIAGLFSILMSVLSPVIEILIGVMKPAIEYLSTVFNGLGQVLEIVATIFKAFSDTLVLALREVFALNDISGVIYEFKLGVNVAIRGLLSFAAHLAMAVGATSVVDNLIKALSAKSGGAVAAPTDVALKSFQQIADDLAQSAYVAQGTGDDKKDEDKAFRAELLSMLGDIRKNTTPADLVRDTLAEGKDLFTYSRFKSGLNNIMENGISGAYENSSLKAGIGVIGSWLSK